jgi:hypothetical protein
MDNDKDMDTYTDMVRTHKDMAIDMDTDTG